jgi:hypothetical protein
VENKVLKLESRHRPKQRVFVMILRLKNAREGATNGLAISMSSSDQHQLAVAIHNSSHNLSV